jgi:PAS domain S-box-containing protein
MGSEAGALRRGEQVKTNGPDFRDFAESSTIALHSVGHDGTILWVNQAELDMLGYTRNEYLGHNIAEFHADAPVIANMLARLLRGEVLCNYEARLRCKDGSIRHVQVSSSGLFENGKFVHTRCFTVDVTEKKTLETALRESERRLRETIDALPAAIYTTDARGRLTHFNKAAVEFAGRVPQLGSDEWCVTWRLFHADGTPLPHDQCPMAIALKEGRAIRGAEAIAERPDGTRRWFMPFPTPLRDAEGKVSGGINLLLDITDRKQSEQMASLLAAVVGSSDDAIVSKNLDGIITSWNRGAERIFGYTAEEALGQHITLIIPQDRRSEETDILARLRRGERIDHFDTIRQRKDGRLLNIALTISPLRDAAGRVVGASKVARDVTDRKRAEAAVADAARQQKALFHLADKLHRASSLDELYTGSMDAICEALQCDRTSILLYDSEGVMRFVAWRGLSNEYRTAVEGHSPWKPDEASPRPVCIEDIDKAAISESLVNIVKAEGIGSLAFIPLVSEGKLIGKFMVYFPVPRVFRSDELDMSIVISQQLAFAIQRKRGDEALRKSEERFRTLSETLDAEVRARTKELELRNWDVEKQSEQLRELSWRLMSTQDEERRHIARELHDSAGQTLTVLGMNLAQLVQKTGRKAPELAFDAERIQETVQQLHREIRTASYLLHPPLLDESGLSSALSWYVEGLAQRSGLQIDLSVCDDFGRLPADMELVVFRLVQECLTNIHRHSGSPTCFIRVEQQDGTVSVQVQDQGKGMSSEKLAEIQSKGSGVGIRGMRERLRQYKGTLNIESGPSGTTVVVTIPVPTQVAADESKSIEPLQAAVQSP